MKTAKNIKAIWDHSEDGWYFSCIRNSDGQEMAGIMPGYGDPEDNDINDDDDVLSNDAREHARYCGFEVSDDQDVEIVR